MGIMLFDWLNARDAVEAGCALADSFPRAAPGEAVREFLQRAVHELRSRKLNLYKRARFANAFKWRLLEKGVQSETAAELTQTLLLQALVPAAPSAHHARVPATAPATLPGDLPGSRPPRNSPDALFRQASECFERGAYVEAVAVYRELVALRPRHVDALHNLGAALARLGRYEEAEAHFRKVISRRPNHAEAHVNLGIALLPRGRFQDAENSFRRALSLKATDLAARSNLGQALLLMGRLDSARIEFEKVLKVAPRHADALYGMGMIARAHGRFDDAEAMLQRALVANPQMARAWSALASLRRMNSSDVVWLKRAQQTAASLTAVHDEAEVRFAIGKYFDDLGNYEKAFDSYKRANELLKTLAAEYDNGVHARFVDDMTRVYTPEKISHAKIGSSTSDKPIFVVGMPRSGTSLVEQILASHPAVAGAGELPFWNDVVRRREAQVRREILGTQLRQKVAEDYLRTLQHQCPDAQYVVDKTPLNSDYLGVIHSVFPNARIIYMRRDPIDTCLSCYFQHFALTLNFSLDLSDLAHYYAEHARLISHWRKVLPPGTILDVPYEELVANQEVWTRKILDFLGLAWDERCLQFHTTQRAVVTSSYWQVRQPLYRGSVQRWRKYSKFIGPLRNLDPA
jgi:tetratricopeptide (TPR) repeat protein